MIGLLNPIEEVQLSAELEQLRVNVDFGPFSGSENYWKTGLFLVAGFINGNGLLALGMISCKRIIRVLIVRLLCLLFGFIFNIYS